MKKFLSLVLAIAMMLTVAVPAFAATFTDIDDSDYKVAIERLAALGIINGKTATEYDPDGIVTRAEMAKLLVVCLGLKTGATILEGTVTFADTQGHWAIGYINVASQYGLIKGDGDGNFRPDDTVNYAEAATMAIRALNYARVVDKTGEWPTNYLNKALELKLFDDVKFTNASDGANRGSIAQMIWNMLISPMWVITQESEADGIYYGKTGETMLKLKFPDYEVKEFTFGDFEVLVEDDEYVVNVTLDNSDYEYAKNDFYKFVPGTIVEALLYKDEECISMYATDDNYLAEGLAKDLADKYEEAADLEDGSYAYLLLSSSKKDAEIINAVEVAYDYITVVKDVETKKATTKITVDYPDYEEYTYTLREDYIVEDGSLIIIDDERKDMSDLKVGDVLTWVGEDVAIATGSSAKGAFKGITIEQTREDLTVTVEIGSKEYKIDVLPMFFETEENDDETEQVEITNLDKLAEKESENEYLGKEVVAYFDEYGRLIKVVFEPISEIEKAESFYLAVDGEEREVVTKDTTEYYAKLENKNGVESYKFEKDFEFDFIAGSLYWVEFNDKGEIEDVTEIAKLEAGALADYDAGLFGGKDDDDYEASYVAGKVDKDYGYIGESDIKVGASTVVYSIVEILNDEDEPTGEYTIEIGKGLEDVEGLENFVVVVDPDTAYRAKYVIAVGTSKSTEKLVGVLESYSSRLDKEYVTISGTKYELDDESMRATVGSVVAFTENDGKAKLVYQYQVTELPDAGEVTKVEEEFITIDGRRVIDMDREKEEVLKENDYRVFVIDVEYNKDFDPYFDAVEEIEIDEINIKKGDFLAIDEDNGYLAIIKGFEK